MKRLWIELQRWNNSRAIICRQCGPVTPRNRRPVAYSIAEMHTYWHPGHVVKVKRFG